MYKFRLSLNQSVLHYARIDTSVESRSPVLGMPESSSARFRSATEFPKTVQDLDLTKADALYQEMRDCLIFTNRSRAQLIRRNEEYKTKASLLKEDIQRLQTMIHQLAADKQRIAQEKQGIIQDLEAEMQTMASHLDELSFAFDGMADIDDAAQNQWSFVSMPNRFFRFLQAVKAIVMWWRSDRPTDNPPLPTPVQPSLSAGEEIDLDDDRRDRPQMYSDPASINRSLLDR